MCLEKEWDQMSLNDQAAKKARQGVAYSVQEDIKVVDPKTLENVPMDGKL